MFEFDPDTQLVDEDTQLVDDLMHTGRLELWWGGSNIKYIELRDRLTGRRVSGKSYQSWNIALRQAVHKLRRLMADEADQ